MSSPQELLAAAKQAAIGGHKEQARELLGRFLQLEPDNEDALILLASVAPDLATMQHNLEQALLINPTNRRALAGMAWVNEQELNLLRRSMLPGAGSRDTGAGIRDTGAQAQDNGPAPVDPAPRPDMGEDGAANPKAPIPDPAAPGSRIPAPDSPQRVRRGTGPLDNSPVQRPGLNEVPLYPNGAFRGLLLELAAMQGEDEVAGLLREAGLASYVGNYPPDDEERGVPYTDYSALGRAMERHYGDGVQNIQLRLGARIVNGGQEEATGHLIAATALRFVPSNILVKRTLDGLVTNAAAVGVPTELEDRSDSYLYKVSVCPYCYGRRTAAGCNALTGVLRAALRNATGKNYRVAEESCRGKGDATCSYLIAKTALD